MRFNKRGMEQSFFIIVGAVLALAILIIMLIIGSKGIGGPFEKIFSLGEEAAGQKEYCAVASSDLCDQYSQLNCQTGTQTNPAARNGYSCTAKIKESTYTCIGKRECGSGKSCCRELIAAAESTLTSP